MNVQDMMQAIGVSKKPTPKAIVLAPEKAKALLSNVASQVKLEETLSFDKSLIMNQGAKMSDLFDRIPAQKAGAKQPEAAGFFNFGSVFGNSKSGTNKN